MPRKKNGVEEQLPRMGSDLADRLAVELKNGREFGQPFIEERHFPNGKIRALVLWDEWDRLALEERTAVILRAYELAEGRDYRNRIALASGLTMPEAHAAGMLPYQILAALRKGDPVTLPQCHQAMLAEGASRLYDPEAPQLRFATEADAEACRQRLIRRLPGSEPVWIINREVLAPEFARLQPTEEVSD